MRLIVCPVDFSPASKSAAEYAAAMATEVGAELVLLHAFDVPVMFTDAPMTFISEASGQLRMQSDRKLRQWGRLLQKHHPGLRWESFSLEGLPHRKAIEFAEEKNADLIVMGTTGTSRLQRVVMGSTVARILRESNTPVIVVPRGASYNGISKILFATDLREDNLRAASMIIPFARSFSAAIDFVYIEDQHVLSDDDAVEKMTKRIRTRIKYPKISGYVARDTSLVKGLDRLVVKLKTDIVVLFTHERHFPESVYHPSVTRLVAHHTHIPLLSIRMTDRPLVVDDGKNRDKHHATA